jgi:hypothetical protein
MSSIYIKSITPDTIYDGYVWSYLIHGLLEDNREIILIDSIPLDLSNFINKSVIIKANAPFISNPLETKKGDKGIALYGYLIAENYQDYYFVTDGLKIKIPIFEMENIKYKINEKIELFFPEIYVTDMEESLLSGSN